MKVTPVVEKKDLGFSLVEVLVVVAILLILLLIWVFPYRRHLKKNRDVQRKSDLHNIKLAYEDYYNDHSCYPSPSDILSCGEPLGDSPPYYLKQIPCDPKTGEPYVSFRLNGDACRGFRILAKLEIENDPDIVAIGCNAAQGCGWEDPRYNYGVAVGDSMISSGWLVGDNGYIYGCVPQQDEFVCNNLDYEVIFNYYDCPKFFMGEGAVSRCVETCCGPDGCPGTEYKEGIVCKIR